MWLVADDWQHLIWKTINNHLNKLACTPRLDTSRHTTFPTPLSFQSLPADSPLPNSITDQPHNMSLQVPHRPKANGDVHGATKAVILVSLPKLYTIANTGDESAIY